MLRAARAVTGCMYCIACGFTHLQRLVRRVGEDTVQLVAEIFYWSLSVYLLSVYLLPTTEHYRPCPSMSLRRRSQLGGCTSRIRDTGHRLHAPLHGGAAPPTSTALAPLPLDRCHTTTRTSSYSSQPLYF